jgi:mannose-6-phosphate isomerase-like protein (cupin superfamily)
MYEIILMGQLNHRPCRALDVVKGTVKVIRGDEQILVLDNQSIYVPIGVAHRLKNPGMFPLEMIQAQSGSHLSDDDIVRLEDTYGRH